MRLDLSGIKPFGGPASKKRLTTKDLIFLTISMAGAQIAWTVELGCVFPSHIYTSFLAVSASRNHRSAYGLLWAGMGRRFC